MAYKNNTRKIEKKLTVRVYYAVIYYLAFDNIFYTFGIKIVWLVVIYYLLYSYC